MSKIISYDTPATLDTEDFPEAVPGQEFERSLALVVGINDYQNGYPVLETAVNDAETLAGILAEQHNSSKNIYSHLALRGRRRAFQTLMIRK